METNKNSYGPEEGKLLSSINKQNPFSVPPNYFDELPSIVSDHIRSKEKQIFLLKPAFALSSLAVFSLMLLLAFFLFKKEVPASPENELSEVDIEYIISNPELYNINETVITEQLLASSTTLEPVSQTAVETISNEEIESFLEENTNDNTIINEL